LKIFFREIKYFFIFLWDNNTFEHHDENESGSKCKKKVLENILQNIFREIKYFPYF